MINFQLFPKNQRITSELKTIVDSFISNQELLDKKSSLQSNDVLSIVRPSLEASGYIVENGKNNKIEIPVLFGENNTIAKEFDADAISKDGKVVVEVEAGRGYANHQFLKDIFEACMMLDVEYLAIAVKNTYITKNGQSKDYEKIKIFLETLYASNRLQLPLKGILLIGYGT